MSDAAGKTEDGASDVRPGFAFAPATLDIAPAYQRDLHGFCDIPPERWGDRIDPTFLARYPIRVIGQTLFASHPGRGYVHMVHRIRQTAPARLGDKVAVTGRFTAVDPVPRGWIMQAAFDYRLPDGSTALRVEPQALMADQSRMPEPGERKPRPAAALDGGFAMLTRKMLTPEKVLGYCGDTDNKIHTDPDYAQRFGFRAPITAGNQIVNFLLEGLAIETPPDSFDVEIRFLRPVFWDDTIVVEGRRGDDGKLQALRAVNEAGKVASTCTVHSLA